jgi:hypothetical protein
MSSIPHKEVRYLIPTAIPVVLIAAVGIKAGWLWVSQRGVALRVACGLLAGALVLNDWLPSFSRLSGPLVDSRTTRTVELAQYLRSVSSPEDVLYAATDFPVLAYYTGRKTVSLLPIQEDFAAKWRQHMSRDGLVVWIHMGEQYEDHSVHATLQPDRQFLDEHPAFRLVREFDGAAVYRYTVSDPASDGDARGP